MLYDKVALPSQGLTLVEYLHSTSLASYTLRVTDINTYNGSLVNIINISILFTLILLFQREQRMDRRIPLLSKAVVNSAPFSQRSRKY